MVLVNEMIVRGDYKWNDIKFKTTLNYLSWLVWENAELDISLERLLNCYAWLKLQAN